ncbi:MAG: M48 family metalloprotease [Candidatus Tectomicrobia bacterium]|uniref:M48 family metalloprotease n=1 Tax=Tectimicrobiota bacterium TaxID=2528274 RepID=A0A932CNX1_UNCTE|nr:M48 family metalloprotease [Candidatus Tectomicrobia bacterium]
MVSRDPVTLLTALDLDIPKVPVCKYSVGLTNSDAVNAFADGFHVILTSGMMRFAEKDEELALVVGHEIAHNALEHVTQNTVNYLPGPSIRGRGGLRGVVPCGPGRL